LEEKETAKIDSYKFWMDQLAAKSTSLRTGYRIYFTGFLEYSGLSPNRLIELQREALASNGDPRENFVVETQVRKWLAELQESKSPSTCRTALCAVKSFFNLNLHPLRLNRQDRPQGDSVGSRIPEKEEVVRIADAAKWKYRAGVMFLKDSGLRISDVVRVEWSDFKDLDDGFWHFKIVTQKRKILATCFIGPETTRLLNQFPTKKGRVFRTGPDNFDDQINWVIQRANVEDVTAHGLRKYFKASLEHARIPEQHILFMMGKKSSVYSEKRVSQLFEDYRKGYPELSVYAQKIQMKEIEDLRKQLGESGKEIADLRRELDLVKEIEDALTDPKVIKTLVDYDKNLSLQKRQTKEIETLKKRIHELEETRYKNDKLLSRIESLVGLPGAREMYEDITRTAEDKLHAILKKHQS